MTSHIDVATANVLCTLGLDDARNALRGVLELAPDLVGLQEWNLSRYRLLQQTGRLGTVPHVGGRLRRDDNGLTPHYLWNAPLVGGCAVGARADRFELIQCRPRLLSWIGRADRPDRWLRVEPPRVATAAVYRHLQANLTVCLVSYHLAPGVQARGRYRADRPILVSRHQSEVRELERLVDDHLRLGQVVFAAGDSNFDGLRVAGLTSAWEGREDDPGTLGPQRKVDDVLGPGTAESVTLRISESDHKAMVVRRPI